MTSSIVSSSPEYRAAQTRIAQARAALCRHGVQAIPNVTVQFAAGVDKYGQQIPHNHSLTPVRPWNRANFFLNFKCDLVF